MSAMLTILGGALVCLMLFLVMRKAMHRQHLYVQIARDKMIVRHIESGREATIEAKPGFSSDEKLIANFAVASNTLRIALKEAEPRKWFYFPRIVMHPLEMIDEHTEERKLRVFHNLAIDQDAVVVKIHIGEPLSDEAILAMFE